MIICTERILILWIFVLAERVPRIWKCTMFNRNETKPPLLTSEGMIIVYFSI